MGDLTMFGKTFNVVGSTESNLVLKTKGDLKILWGSKFIDLIKNGKIVSSAQDFLKTAPNSDQISSNGIYLVLTEKGAEIWAYIEGAKILLNSPGELYISFLENLKLTSLLKDMALTNIGFNYETLTEAKNANIVTGIIFIKELNKLFSVTNGVITEYLIAPSDKETTFTKIKVGNIEIFNSFIKAAEQLNLCINNDTYVTLLYGLITINGDIIMNSGGIKSFGATSQSGYRLYLERNKTILEIDELVVRDSITIPSIYIDVTVEEFRELIISRSLDPNQLYRLYNFRNFWQLYTKEILTGNDMNVFPLIVTAKNNFEYFTNKCFFLEDDSYIFTYDINHKQEYVIGSTSMTSLGLITYAKDSNNNECNYNFKHLKFLHENVWSYTFPEGSTNNKITLYDIRVETLVDGEVLVFEDLNNYAIFELPCHNNIFNALKSPIYIKNNFNNNTINGNWKASYVNINNCIFKKDVTGIINALLESCTFKYDIIDTTLFTKGIFKNCQFNTIIKGIIEEPNDIIREVLQSDEDKLIIVYTNGGIQKIRVLADSLIELPSGAIIMWHGSEIPNGWVICDGENDTPNLLGRFIKAVSTPAEVGEISSELNDKNELTIKLENLPKHGHTHLPHTHELSLSDLSGTTENSKTLEVSLQLSDYNYGITSNSKKVVTSVTGEGVTIGTDTVNSVSDISTLGGTASGGVHSHTIEIDTDGKSSLKESTSKETVLQDAAWPNKAIKIEPRAYALIFIMKL